MAKKSLKVKQQRVQKFKTREFVIDDTLERSKIEAKQLLDEAKIKSKKIIEDAEDQADLIINECLMEASKSEMRINNLKDELRMIHWDALTKRLPYFLTFHNNLMQKKPL